MFETWMLLRESQMQMLVIGIVGMLGLITPVAVYLTRAYVRGFLLGMYRRAYTRGRRDGYQRGWHDHMDIAQARRREELRNARRTSEPRGDGGPNARVSKARISSKD